MKCYEKWFLYSNTNVESDWMPIKPLSKEIQIGNNKNHSITMIQFSIQLASTRIINRFQGLTMVKMAFDSTCVTKYGLTHTALS